MNDCSSNIDGVPKHLMQANFPRKDPEICFLAIQLFSGSSVVGRFSGSDGMKSSCCFDQVIPILNLFPEMLWYCANPIPSA
jgi:hypothetical protein